MSQIRLGLAQPLPLFLRVFAVSDVDDSTNVFNETAGCIDNGMAYRSGVSDFAAGMNDPVIEFELLPLPYRVLNYSQDPCLIVRMNALQEIFKTGLPAFRVKALHAEAFL